MERKVFIRPMTEEDLERVTAIEGETFSVPWTRDGFASALKMGGSRYLVAECGEEGIVGYCGYYSFMDEAEITNVAIAAPYRGQGYAKTMLQELLLQAKKDLIEKVVLEVRFSNAGAIGLYENMGFKKLGVRKDFYEKPREDAIIMMLDL